MIWDYLSMLCNMYMMLFVLLHSGPKESMLDQTQVCEKTNLNYKSL